MFNWDFDPHSLKMNLFYCRKFYIQYYVFKGEISPQQNKTTKLTFSECQEQNGKFVTKKCRT